MAKKELPKTYDHKQVEERLYQWWEESGFFTPKIDWSKKPFVISMPPSNITGELHMGHGITMTIQDILIRWHRMMGEPTLWLPGNDHASIGTHNVIEKELAKKGLTRWDLGREKFMEYAWAWKEKYGHLINQQLRRLGCSCDWTRERFTMDEMLSRAVRVSFVRLYKKGLIYRGNYLVNWCPRCHTAISDLEVVHDQQETYLWYVHYPLVGPDGRPSDEHITVATTRPETILGDTAVAVNPNDRRYKKLVGRTAILPVLGRHIPIIADERVDPKFGTGAVKVTPGHDPNDYEIGQRHNLGAINILNADGTMNDNAGPYAGQDRLECRQNLVADLERQGLLAKVEPYTHAVGHCQRCDTIIEPLISEQWFVKTKPLAEPAIRVVREGRIKFIPKRFEKVYFNWMENIRDWCISRQLWWGHRIPVWYCDDCGEMMVAEEDPTECSCGSKNIRQDPDILDTWYSSGLWPFSTLGWPDDTGDLRYFYPTTVMETGYDIIFFWVARMIMQGLECTGDIPFRYVYLHGMVRDEHGKKMSRSWGNVIDPLEVIEKYGCDALRYALVTASTPGNDLKLSLQKVEAGRNFANKIWNAARFVLSNLDGYEPPRGDIWEEPHLTLADRWILTRLSQLTGSVTKALEDWQLGEAGRQIHDFLWGEYCDWYIEISKIALYGDDSQARATAQKVLVYVLERALRLLHPYMPFITEEIWQHLPHEGETLMLASWPKPDREDNTARREIEVLMEMVRAIRNARAEYEVDPGRAIPAIVVAGRRKRTIEAQRDILVKLARLDPAGLTITAKMREKPRQAVALVTGSIETYLPLAGMVDLERERERVKTALATLEKELARAEALLSDENFVAKAPQEVVDKERTKLADYQEQRRKLAARLELLGK